MTGLIRLFWHVVGGCKHWESDDQLHAEINIAL
jgi:hypothetical protein